jgi:formate hydrogenlyase subunit 6/NADH:ubiquinone oxidoreductase subunit I
MTQGMPEIDLGVCTGCGDCVEHCPTGAVGMVGGKAALVRPEDCRYCTDCEEICPAGAIKCPFVIILAERD